MHARTGILAMLLVGAGCSTQTSPRPADSCPLADRTLTLTAGELRFDGEGTFSVEGAEPGETVHFWWTAAVAEGCSCPDETPGCLELDRAEPVGTAIADASGRAALTVALPPDARVGERRIQAAAASGVSAVSTGFVSGWTGGQLDLADAQYRVLGEGIGGSVDSAGDLDFDGRASIVAGAPGLGVVWVFEPPVRDGGPVPHVEDLPEATRLVGPRSTGAVVAGVGDLDGDGIGDLLIAAPAVETVYLVHGPLPPGEHALEVEATASLTLPGLGTALDSGDIDGDGRIDLVLGGTDRVWIDFDADLVVDVELAGLVDPQVAVVGDLDADGMSDLAIASGDEIMLYFGPGIPEPGLTLPDATLAALGDANGDGFDDVPLGSPLIAGGRGGVALVYGPISPLVTVIEGSAPGEGVGAFLSGAGDLDGDGKADLLVGSPDDGRVMLLYGPPEERRSTLDADAFFLGEGAGTALVGPGDLDGDDFDDLVIGATAEDGTGGIYIFRGAPGW